MNNLRVIKSGNHIFEIVEEFPDSAVVWNIGRHNFQHEQYIPLAFIDNSWDDNYHIDPQRLKAIKVRSEEIALHILDVAHHETVDKEKFMEIIQQK